jgi:aminoglycoside phosphotransferase (APT) family kinase protein
MPNHYNHYPRAILVSLGITDAGKIEPVTGGTDTATWRVEWNNAYYALRVFGWRQIGVPEHEARMMRLAGENGIPVPTVVRKGMYREYRERLRFGEAQPVLLLSWITGKTLAAELQAHPRQIKQLGSAFGRMQAAIHRIPAPPEMDTTSWIEWAGDEPELKRRLLDLPSRKNRLLHLDYHPLNVMADGGQISGVLDWVNARAGDPRADFARTYAILRIERYSPEGDNLKLAIARRLLAYFWRQGYMQAGGQLDDMALFYAWAGASMIRDLSQKIGRPDIWLQDHHLDSVRAWRDHWKQQAGIKP